MFQAIEAAMTSIRLNKAPHIPELIGQVRLAILAIGHRKGWNIAEIEEITRLVTGAMLSEFAKQGMLPTINLN